MQTSLYQ